MLEVFEAPPNFEIYDYGLESTYSLYLSFQDSKLGGDSLSLIELRNADISIPVGDWLYNQPNSGKYYSFTNIIYRLETKDAN